MEEIDAKTFNDAENLAPVRREEFELEEMTDEKFQLMLNEMENPVKAKKELAVKIKRFLDHQIDKELKKSGALSSATRSWVDSYEKMLSGLQKDIHGDKSVNLHLHKLSHSEVASKMREQIKIVE